MFCAKCGKEIPQFVFECPYCGAQVIRNEPAAKPRKNRLSYEKALFIIVIAFICIALVNKLFGGGSAVTNISLASSTTVNESSAHSPGIIIRILSEAVGKDYLGKPALLVKYEFTNKTDKANSFTALCEDTAYQNGVECRGIVVSTAFDAQRQLNKVQPNKAYTLTVGYLLRDKTTPVKIEVQDYSGEETYLTQIISLK